MKFLLSYFSLHPSDFLLASCVVSVVYGWELLRKEPGNNQTDYYIQCGNGEKWRLVQRHSDGWFAAPEGTGSYMYKSLDEAAKAVCRE